MFFLLAACSNKMSLNDTSQQDDAALAIPSSLLAAAVAPPAVEVESQQPVLQLEGMTPDLEEEAPVAAPQAADSLLSSPSPAPTELALPPAPPSLEPQHLSQSQLGPGPEPKVLTYLPPPPKHLPATPLEYLVTWTGPGPVTPLTAPPGSLPRPSAPLPQPAVLF